MFAAEPLPPGGDLNEIEENERRSRYRHQSVFGPPTTASVKTAQAFQKQHSTPQVDINAIFMLLEQEQNQGVDEVEEVVDNDIVVASSSVSAIDDDAVTESPAPPPKKPRGRGGKASAKTVSSPEVVKKTSTDFNQN